MKKQIEIEVIKDSGTPDDVLSVGHKEIKEITCCDICQKEIADGQNIGTEEDFCVVCFERRLIIPFMRIELEWGNEEITNEMRLIIAKFNKIKRT